MKILTQEILQDESWPDWYNGKRVDELMFCRNFLAKHPMKCIRDRLFTVDGPVEDERQISQLILQEISGCVTKRPCQAGVQSAGEYQAAGLFAAAPH